MRVLVATDGSENARAAIEWLRTFPLAKDSTLLVLNVEQAGYVAPAALYAPGVEDLLLANARQVVDEARDELAPAFPNVERRIARGEARDTIVRTAREWHADLVVVGARGLSGLGSWPLGSVSSAVVHGAPCPVLVVKGQPRPGLRRVVLGVDGSPHAIAATCFLAALPLPRRVALTIVGVVHPPFLPMSAAGAPLPALMRMMDDALEARQLVIAEALDDAARELKDRVDVAETRQTIGHPVEALVNVAGEPEVDLVVVGARGLGLVSRLVLGSVSDAVLHRVDRPVLVVKPPLRTTCRGGAS